MKRLVLKASYGQTFTHQKLPRLFLKLIRTELNKPTNITILTYIRDIYDINYIELNRLLAANLLISMYADNVIIRFNNIKIKETEDGEPVFLETLINIINYGNREVRGLNIINDIINYLGSHIDTLYKLSKVRGGSDIWQ